MITAEYPTVTPPAAPPPVAPPPVATEPPHSLPRILLGLILVVRRSTFVSGARTPWAFPWRFSYLCWPRPSSLIARIRGGARPSRSSRYWPVRASRRRSRPERRTPSRYSCWMLALAGDSFYNPADPAWTRWYSQCSRWPLRLDASSGSPRAWRRRSSAMRPARVRASWPACC